MNLLDGESGRAQSVCKCWQVIWLRLLFLGLLEQSCAAEEAERRQKAHNGALLLVVKRVRDALAGTMETLARKKAVKENRLASSPDAIAFDSLGQTVYLVSCGARYVC